MTENKKKNGFKNGKNAEKNTQIKGLIMTAEEFNKLFNSGGSKNNYNALISELKKFKEQGAYAKIYSFQELSELTGCKPSDGAARNVAQYVKENHSDIIKQVKVSKTAGIIGFVFKK